VRRWRLIVVVAAAIAAALATAVAGVALNVATGGTAKWFPTMEQHYLRWLGSSTAAVAICTLFGWWAQRWFERGLETLAPVAPVAPQRPRPGKPIRKYTGLDLGIYSAIDLGDESSELSELPRYAIRAHDGSLRQVVDAAARGQSQMVVLVGESATGKTRACWEVIQYLPERWRLWYPEDPIRPKAFLHALAEVGPHTVIWLDEVQHYLLTVNRELGERIAAALRDLLADPDRGPVLVLGTVWPQYWTTLTSTPEPGCRDLHEQARRLLAAAGLRVPKAFNTPADLDALRAAAAEDPRLQQAADHAEDNRITQYLAGVPMLLDRYRNAPAVARAVIDAAIDARRLGHLLSIPRALLERAAPGYLSESEWGEVAANWPDAASQALATLGKPAHGILGPLTRIWPRPGEESESVQPDCYRLADSLEQMGRIERVTAFPPGTFWDAIATTCADPEILWSFAQAAHTRGRLRRAFQLYQCAADRGHRLALRRLNDRGDPVSNTLVSKSVVHRGDEDDDSSASQPMAGRQDDAVGGATSLEASELAELLGRKHQGVRHNRAKRYGGADGVPGEAGAGLDADTWWSHFLLLEEAGDVAGAQQLLHEAIDHGDAAALQLLAEQLEEAGQHAEAERLVLQTAPPNGNDALRWLALQREDAGQHADAERLIVELDKRGRVYSSGVLAKWRERKGDVAGAERLYRAAARQGHMHAWAWLARQRERRGDLAGAEQIWRGAADSGQTAALVWLAKLRDRVGDVAGGDRLTREAADRGNPNAMRWLAERSVRAGDAAGGQRLNRYGLTDQGDISEPWD
jgi:hypothetical protein